MGLLRNLAHMIFGLLLLTALWVTALTTLSTKSSATAIITDLGVDALNPWLVSKGFGVSAASYAKLEQSAGANPGKPLALSFIKPEILGSEIKGLPYDRGMHVIYGHVASAYYSGGPKAAFALPASVASAVQTFALFPEQYNSIVKSTGLPTWLQPFMLFTGLSPETFTTVGHASMASLLPKFWFAVMLFAGAILLLNLLTKNNLVKSLGAAALHGSWPTLAVFGFLWLVNKLYPTNFHAVAAAFGVVAGAFVPAYAIAAAVGVVLFLVGMFGGSVTKLFGGGGKSGEKASPVMAPTRGGYSTRADESPSYTPGGGYQPGPSSARQPWEQASPGWGGQPTREANPGTWNQPRPWDEPDPDSRGQGASWREYPPIGPDDTTSPRRHF